MITLKNIINVSRGEFKLHVHARAEKSRNYSCWNALRHMISEIPQTLFINIPSPANYLIRNSNFSSNNNESSSSQNDAYFKDLNAALSRTSLTDLPIFI